MATKDQSDSEDSASSSRSYSNGDSDDGAVDYSRKRRARKSRSLTTDAEVLPLSSSIVSDWKHDMLLAVAFPPSYVNTSDYPKNDIFAPTTDRRENPFVLHSISSGKRSLTSEDVALMIKYYKEHRRLNPGNVRLQDIKKSIGELVLHATSTNNPVFKICDLYREDFGGPTMRVTISVGEEDLECVGMALKVFKEIDYLGGEIRLALDYLKSIDIHPLIELANTIDIFNNHYVVFKHPYKQDNLSPIGALWCHLQAL